MSTVRRQGRDGGVGMGVNGKMKTKTVVVVVTRLRRRDAGQFRALKCLALTCEKSNDGIDLCPTFFYALLIRLPRSPVITPSAIPKPVVSGFCIHDTMR